MKTRQTCNSFSLLPFQEDCLLFFALFYYTFLFLKLERGGGCNPRNPPSRSANEFHLGLARIIWLEKMKVRANIEHSNEYIFIYLNVPYKFNSKFDWKLFRFLKIATVRNIYP